MKYEGKVYGKVAGRYIELTQTVQDLEKLIEDLKQENHRLKDALAILNTK
jgi:cell division protein FtsB